MNKDDLTYFKKWFARYVGAFRTGDPAGDKTIGLKVAHTRRVCEEIVRIAEALGVSGSDLLLAETTAVFHDVGRFKQYRDHGTFNDAASRNHAELGLAVLAEHEVLTRCSVEEADLVRRVIGYHNVRVLPEEKDRRIRYFAALLRDADKLDIWKVFVDYYTGRYDGVDSAVVWGLPEGPGCSPAIIEAVNAGKMADTKHMVTINDFKLLQISWVFDLNFPPAFRAVLERRYLEKIGATLPDRPDITGAVAVAKAYLQRQSRGPWRANME